MGLALHVILRPDQEDCILGRGLTRTPLPTIVAFMVYLALSSSAVTVLYKLYCTRPYVKADQTDSSLTPPCSIDLFFYLINETISRA
jgi:hypothetical protein